MRWFRSHPAGTLWIVWLGGGALLAFLVWVAQLDRYNGGLSWPSIWMITIFSVGYFATLMRVCYWVLEEKAQDRSLMLAFFTVIGGIAPILVALLGKNHHLVDRSIKVTKAVNSSANFDIEALVAKGKKQPLDKDRSSEQARQKAQEYLHRAVEYDNQGDHDKAIAEYTAAINAYNQNAMAYFNRATLLVKVGKKGVARTDFNRAIDLAGDTDLGKMAKRALEQLDGGAS